MSKNNGIWTDALRVHKFTETNPSEVFYGMSAILTPAQVSYLEGLWFKPIELSIEDQYVAITKSVDALTLLNDPTLQAALNSAKAKQTLLAQAISDKQAQTAQLLSDSVALKEKEEADRLTAIELQRLADEALAAAKVSAETSATMLSQIAAAQEVDAASAADQQRLLEQQKNDLITAAQVAAQQLAESEAAIAAAEAAKEATQKQAADAIAAAEATKRQSSATTEGVLAQLQTEILAAKEALRDKQRAAEQAAIDLVNQQQIAAAAEAAAAAAAATAATEAANQIASDQQAIDQKQQELATLTNQQ